MDEMYDNATVQTQFYNDVQTFSELSNGVYQKNSIIRSKRIFREDHGLILQKFGITVSDLFQRAKIDTATAVLLSIFLSKDAKKQNKTENILLNYLNYEIPSWKFEILPKSGPDSIRFSVDGETKPKSMDLIGWGVKGKIFIAHKFTNGEGGAQDNIKIEIETLIRQWNKIDNGGARLVVILDGSYWRLTKHRDLFNFGNTTPNVVVCHHEELKDKI